MCFFIGNERSLHLLGVCFALSIMLSSLYCFHRILPCEIVLSLYSSNHGTLAITWSRHCLFQTPNHYHQHSAASDWMRTQYKSSYLTLFWLLQFCRYALSLLCFYLLFSEYLFIYFQSEEPMASTVLLLVTILGWFLELAFSFAGWQYSTLSLSH
jgi:hypothetical protein